MKKAITILMMSLVLGYSAMGQKGNELTGIAKPVLVSNTEIPNNLKLTLDNSFHQYKVYHFNAEGLQKYARHKPEGFDVQLNFGDFDLYAHVRLNDVMASGFIFRVGDKLMPRPEAITYAGYLIGDEANSDVRMTINNGVFSAFVQTDNAQYAIESAANFDGSANKSLYIAFNTSDAKFNAALSGCEAAKAADYLKNLDKGANSESSASAEVCLEWAVAAEYSASNRVPGGATGVQQKVQTLANVASGFYAFAEIKFKLVEFYIEPSQLYTWGSTDYLYDLLDNFEIWAANTTNFQLPHDVATVYSGRDLRGNQGYGTSGLASTGAVSKVVCTQKGINILELFSPPYPTDAANGVHISHEVGHNFGVNHEGSSGCIMTSSLTGANSNWSFANCPSASNTILSAKSTLTCLGSCSSAPAPAFQADNTTGCNGSLTVQFTDFSSGNPSSWEWDFGDGSTSTQQNPSHTYSAEGTYNVALTVTNEFGSNSTTKTNYITVGQGGPKPSEYAGEKDNTIGNGGFAGGGARWMGFKALDNFTLKSIKVYAGMSGPRHFFLTENQATQVSEKQINLNPGESRVELNFSCEKGKTYELWVDAEIVGGQQTGYIQDLYRNTDGATYPREIPGVISIYENYWHYTDPNNNLLKGWYVGYDWEIAQEGCAGFVGIEDNDLDGMFSIYPNPAKDVLNIEMNYKGTVEIKILSLMGQLMYSDKMNNNNISMKHAIRLEALTKGTYLLQLSTGNNVIVKKLIVL